MERRLRSQSPARSKSPARPKSPARGTRRSRSRSRGRSPSRKVKLSPSPSPSRKVLQTGSPSKSPKKISTPSTPVRRSARIAELEEKSNENKESGDHVAASKANNVTVNNGGLSKPVKSSSVCSLVAPVFLLAAILSLAAGLLAVFDLCAKGKCKLKMPKPSLRLADYLTYQSFSAYAGFLLFQLLLTKLPLGSVVCGQRFNDGEFLKYRCNGLISLIVTGILFASGVYFKSPAIGFIAGNLRHLCCAAIVLSFLISVILYLRASTSKSGLMQFYLGCELNPRLCGVDVKVWALRSGLITWAIITGVIILEAQKSGKLSPALALLAAGQLLYVGDALLFEDSMFSTWTFKQEKLGWMLTFGSMAVVPFMYSLQSRFLLYHQGTLPVWALSLIVLLNICGYLVFRGSNSQKDMLRRDPHNPALAHLDVIPTSSGQHLLASGWWGICQHPNYLGDLMMALAWSMFCGFDSVIPYVYPIYLLVLLIHRQRRVHHACAEIHGAAWTRYIQKVPHRLFPKIY